MCICLVSSGLLLSSAFCRRRVISNVRMQLVYRSSSLSVLHMESKCGAARKKSVLVGVPLKRLGPVRRKGSRQIRSLPVCWRLLVLDKRHNQQPHLGREDVKTFCYMHHRPHHLLPRPAQCSVFCGIHFGIGIRPVHLQLNAAPSGCIGHCYALYGECQQMSSAWQTKRAEKPRRSHRRSCLHSLGCTLGVLLGCLHGCGTARA